MEKLLIDQVAVFESTDGLYISRGDHSLVNVRGKDTPMVLNIIRAFREDDSADANYQRLRDKYGIDESYYNRVINWLVNNRVLRADAPVATSDKTITVIGQFGADRAGVERVLGVLSHPDLTYRLHQYINVRDEFDAADFDPKTDVVLYVSPLFEHYERFKQISSVLYKSKVNCLHVGIDEHTYTLGPLVLPAVHSPCLKCYAQRKIVNMANPDEYVKFTALFPVDQLTDFGLTSIRHFDLLIQHARLELADFFRSGRSELIGKSVVTDLFGHTTQVSKVLKVPTCDVCGCADNLYAPFN